MHVTRSQGLLAAIVVAMLLSIGITGYQTLIRADYAVIEPEEEMEEEVLPGEDAIEEELPTEGGTAPVEEEVEIVPVEEDSVS